MKYLFVDESWEDYLYWQKTDKKVVAKINDLLKDIAHSPFSGIGKPEPLKYKYKGFWSRRIDGEHRLIYQVKDDEILIAKCRFHYESPPQKMGHNVVMTGRRDSSFHFVSFGMTVSFEENGGAVQQSRTAPPQ